MTDLYALQNLVESELNKSVRSLRDAMQHRSAEKKKMEVLKALEFQRRCHFAVEALADQRLLPRQKEVGVKRALGLLNALEDAGCDDQAILEHCRETVCEGCDGEGSLMYELAKTAAMQCGGKKIPFTDSKGQGFYYVNAQGQEMEMKTIGGSCSKCGGIAKGIHAKGCWVVDLLLGKE